MIDARRRARTAPLALAAVAALLATAAGHGPAAALLRDDDRPVDLGDPDARRAVAVALDVVRGRAAAVARDADDGNWEVTVRSDLGEFEVELHPADLSFLAIDYD